MDVLQYREGERNQLANCMVLTAQEKGAGGKSDTPPDQWFADKWPEYLAKHLIPHDPALWQLSRFEEFIEARKALILDKMRELKLVSHDTGPPLPPTVTVAASAGFTATPPGQ